MTSSLYPSFTKLIFRVFTPASSSFFPQVRDIGKNPGIEIGVDIIKGIEGLKGHNPACFSGKKGEDLEFNLC